MTTNEPRCALCTCLLSRSGRAQTDKAICPWCENDLHRREKKRCTKCNTAKPCDEFIPVRKGSATLRSHCKACMRQQREGYLAKPDVQARKSAYDRQYRENNPEKVKEQQRRWRENNPDKVQAQRERRYQRFQQRREKARGTLPPYYTNRNETRKDSERRYREHHREQERERHRLYSARKKLEILHGK